MIGRGGSGQHGLIKNETCVVVSTKGMRQYGSLFRQADHSVLAGGKAFHARPLWNEAGGAVRGSGGIRADGIAAGNSKQIAISIQLETEMGGLQSLRRFDQQAIAASGDFLCAGQLDRKSVV